jgi:hypothetical protein
MSGWRIQRPPCALRIANLDNLVLVPASLLSNMSTYQAAANRLPRGQVLIVLPSLEGAPRRVMQDAAAQLRRAGHLVIMQGADNF